MCGIVGIIGFRASVPAELLERATRSLAHRGPDDSGTVILRDFVGQQADQEIEIGLGNRRLAILDLSPLGHQPMNDPATGNWIVYNGEVYNFREVREKLAQAGLRFNSLSDTEVILKAYAHWGENCLQEFRGMFAFAIWDAQRHRLFVARDPMGIKPLYYFQSNQYFIFSSEVRTLLGTGLVPRAIDPAGLINYLTFGSVYDPNTLVKGVRALPPGHSLTWKDGHATLAEYWDAIGPARNAACDSGETRGESEELIAAMLDECVRMQLASDVPVGVFLSGGIDSSSLVGILDRNHVRPSTFSIAFQEADYTEAEYSRKIAKQFRTDHHEIDVSQSDFFAAIDPAIRAMDQPTMDGINTYFVSERTRAAGVKVALSGLGGDEIFAGYSSFRTVPRMEKFAEPWRRVPAIARSLSANIFSALTSASDQNRKLTALVQNGGGKTQPYFLARMLFTPQMQNELLRTANVDCNAFSCAERPLNEAVYRAQSLDPVNRVSYLEARCYMLNTLLRDADCMSMAHGLEVRVPLIDHQLVRRVLALPGSWKLDKRTPKPLLVHALRGELPDEIIHRPKRGFTMPFEHWLRDALRPVMEESLRKIGDGVLGTLINERGACLVREEFLAGRTSWSRPWSLYVLQQWCQQHLSS
ncbi:MAG: asparagine synthase (glutamine-hydrolyzing) [Candidatus Sulfotelmatobacter sp.]